MSTKGRERRLPTVSTRASGAATPRVRSQPKMDIRSVPASDRLTLWRSGKPTFEEKEHTQVTGGEADIYCLPFTSAMSADLDIYWIAPSSSLNF